jgi:phage shock protein PspC (stress-responsive transcriptional regulator)
MTNLETEPTPLPPPTPAAAPSHNHRWARSDDRVALGVAGGLGRALAIDPLFVRIAFVVLGLFSGVGILLYVAGYALLADSPTSPPPFTIRRIGGGIALLLSLRWLFNGDAQLPGAGWVVAIGLLGAAIALWRGRAPVEVRTAPIITDAQPSADGGSTTDRWDALTAQRRNRPRPPRSALALLSIGAATVVGALVWLLAGSSGNRGALAFGFATIVLGLGLVIGTFVGRARWLIIPALLTASAALAASALSFAGVDLDHRSGDRTEFIQPGSAIAPEYRTSFGHFELDLTNYPGDVSTSVDVAVGSLTVVVPDNAEVQLDAAIGIGSIDALGATRNGYRRTLSLDDSTTGARVIKLNLRVGVGHLEVRRGSFFEGAPVLISPTTIGPDIPALQNFGDGTVLFEDGSIDFGDGRRIEADGSYQIPIVAQNPDGSVQLDNGAVIRADGTVVSPGGFVISRHNTPTVSTVFVPAVPGGVPTTISPTTVSEVQP